MLVMVGVVLGIKHRCDQNDKYVLSYLKETDTSFKIYLYGLDTNRPTYILRTGAFQTTISNELDVVVYDLPKDKVIDVCFVEGLFVYEGIDHTTNSWSVVDGVITPIIQTKTTMDDEYVWVTKEKQNETINK